MIKNIPNFFTLANLFFGSCAIVFILQSGETLVRLNVNNEIITYLPEKIWFGTLFIFLAAIMDFFDGYIARLLKVTSDLGKQLDSLSDVVSFGVAPAMILYQILRIGYTHIFDSLNLNWFLLSPAFLIACFAAYRLGKFNLDTRQTTFFIGLPTPAMAIFVSSLPLIIWKNYFNLNYILVNPFFIYLLIIILCFLMVSEIKFFAFKIKKPFKNNIILFSILILSLISFIIFKWFGIAISWILYVLISIIFKTKY